MPFSQLRDLPLKTSAGGCMGLMCGREGKSLVATYDFIHCNITVIQSFASQGARNVFDNSDSKAARRTCPRTLWTDGMPNYDNTAP